MRHRKMSFKIILTLVSIALLLGWVYFAGNDPQKIHEREAWECLQTHHITEADLRTPKGAVCWDTYKDVYNPVTR